MIITRTLLAEFARLDTPSLPWSPRVRHIVLSKQPERIEATCVAFGERLPEEIRRCVAARRYEYVLGRLAAGALLSEYGISPSECWIQSIQRRPVWPAHVTGSISHSTQAVSVSVALVGSSLQCIGTDLEILSCSATTMDSLSLCFSPLERQRLELVEHGGLIGFAAKEALFKCLNPLCGLFFDFTDVELDLVDAEQRSFEIRLLTRLSAYLPAGTCLRGSYQLLADHVWAGVRWPA